MSDGHRMLGRLLGDRYRLQRLIARGGMGEVFEATDEQQAGGRVAMKVLRTDLGRDAEWCARFKREADVASAIESPHIARALDIGKTHTGRRWIAFEFLDGESLDARLERDRIVGFTEASWMIEHALVAMDVAHRAGVVHRDIKPANLFVVRTNDRPRLCVLDFGIAKQIRRGRASSNLTRAHAILGTPLYMSPEQVVDPKTVDARADLFSVGLVLYRALAGHLPGRRSSEVPSLAGATGRSWPDELESWTRHMVAIDRNERFDSAAASLNAWRQAVAAVRGHVHVTVPRESVHEDTDLAPFTEVDS